MPVISIAMPISEGRLHNVVGTLRSLSYQTMSPNDFEVCLGVDGNNIEPAVRAIKAAKPAFAVRYDYVGGSASAIRRNAARNRACALCTAPLMMINDADMMLPPNALSEIVFAHHTMLSHGRHVATFQRLARIENDLDSWRELSTDYMKGTIDTAAVLARSKVSARIFDSFASIESSALRNKPFLAIKTVKENFPTIETWLWKDLGGFDERFVGWGGNKQEFVERLKRLSRLGLIELLLLPRVTLYHQPHATAADAFNKTLRKHNSELFSTIVNKHQYHNWEVCEKRIRASLAKTSYAPRPVDGISIVSYTQDPEPYKIAAEEAGLQVQVLTPAVMHVTHSSPEAWCEAALSFCEYQRTLLALDDQFTAVPTADQWHIGTVERDGWIMSDTHSLRNHLIGLIRTLGSAKLVTSILANDAAQQTANHRAMHRISKPHYLFRPHILSPAMCIGIITYNRPTMLQKTIETLIASKSPHIQYTLAISDDNSGAGTVSVLEWARKTHGANIIYNDKRGGVAEQSNRILRFYDGLPGLGVLANDDLLFAQGWDEAYLEAYRRTQWSHFVFMDTAFEKRIRPELYPANSIMLDHGVLLVNWRRSRIQGALVTFDQRSIDQVGAFDAARFGLFSHEHVDWTLRHQRAKLAPGHGRLASGCYDVLGMDKYVALNMEKYRRSVTDKERDPSNETRFNVVEKKINRIYLPLGSAS